MTFGGRFGVHGEVGPNAHFNASFEIANDQKHRITWTDAGNESDQDTDDVITPGTREVNPLHAPVNVFIAVWPWGAYLGEDALENGVRIKISSWRRNAQNALPSSAKATGQYINGVLAKIESVKAGYDEERAAQLIMRNLMVAGVAAPAGGDARGWKRHLFWRADLSFGLASAEAKEEYRDFTRELETIPPGDRVRRVLAEQLWDRRRPLRLASA